MIKELEDKYSHIGLKVEIVSKRSNHMMNKNGKQVKRFYEWKKKKTLGAFAHHPPPPKLYITEDCTKLTWKHEVWHLEDYSISPEKYIKKPSWKREEYVWQKIWENKHMWTEEELVDSYHYYTTEAYRTGGEPKSILEMKKLILKHPERVKN